MLLEIKIRSVQLAVEVYEIGLPMPSMEPDTTILSTCHPGTYAIRFWKQWAKLISKAVRCAFDHLALEGHTKVARMSGHTAHASDQGSAPIREGAPVSLVQDVAIG